VNVGLCFIKGAYVLQFECCNVIIIVIIIIIIIIIIIMCGMSSVMQQW
jgi:hypothetical protein